MKGTVNIHSETIINFATNDNQVTR